MPETRPKKRLPTYLSCGDNFSAGVPTRSRIFYSCSYSLNSVEEEFSEVRRVPSPRCSASRARREYDLGRFVRALGLVHGQISGPQQLFGLLLRTHGDADARSC